MELSRAYINHFASSKSLNRTLTGTIMIPLVDAANCTVAFNIDSAFKLLLKFVDVITGIEDDRAEVTTSAGAMSNKGPGYTLNFRIPNRLKNRTNHSTKLQAFRNQSSRTHVLENCVDWFRFASFTLRGGSKLTTSSTNSLSMDSNASRDMSHVRKHLLR